MSESGFTGLEDLQDCLIRNSVNPKILLIKILTIFTGLLVRNPENPKCLNQDLLD
jgi:hypothetical protein